MDKSLLKNENAVSPVIGAILMLAIGVTILTSVQLNFIPVWNTQEELGHIQKMFDDFKELKSGIESTVQSGTTSSLPIIMGFKYSPKFLVYNPKESAFVSLEIKENTWAEVRYNEMFPDGMTDETSIKNVTTSTITYALMGQKYNSFIYEHGMIRRSSSNFSTSSQVAIINGTIYLLSVKPLGPETTSGVEVRTVNIYPTSQQKNSVIGKNVWLILHTKPEYVNWWKEAIEKEERGTVKIANNTTGIVVASFNNTVIKLGEAYISTTSSTAPPHAQPYRIVKITPDNTYMPVDGITTLVAEVQDKYNNPVPNELVSFNINKSRKPANANDNVLLLQDSAISGTDGRASVSLKTNGAGFYYIDASVPESSTTFVYPASSQGGVLSLSQTGSLPGINITATLKDSLGGTQGFKQIIFDTNDGILSDIIKTTTIDGNASTTLNVSNAIGISITNIQASNITTNSAAITWDTSNNIIVSAQSGYIFNSIKVPTTVNTIGCVQYGTSSRNYSSMPCDIKGTVSSHSVNLSGLLPSTGYYFKVNSSNEEANIDSTEYMFVTLPGSFDTTPPASVTNLNYTSGPMYINWTWTDPADPDFDHVELDIDLNPTITVSKGQQYYNTSYFLPNSVHTIFIRTIDYSGNANSTWNSNQASIPTLLSYVFDFLAISGNISGKSNAQNASDGGATANLSKVASGGIDTDNYTNVTSNTNGIIASFSNMQNSTDSGAFATLTEEQTLTNQNTRTMNPIKSLTSGSQSATYNPGYLDIANDGNIDVTISNITQTVSIVKHASANPTMVIGTISSGSYSNSLSSDNSYLQLREINNCNPCALDSNWNSWQAVNEASNSSIVEMNIGIEAYGDQDEAVYIQLWDFPNNNWNTTWRQLGGSGLPTSNTNAVFWHNITNANEIQRFINSAGNYRLRFADANIAIGSSDNTRSRFYIDEFKVLFKYNLYTLNASYTFTETNSSTTWHSLSIKDSSYGDSLANVSILNATSGTWEAIHTTTFTGGNSPIEHVNVVKGANGNASSYDTGGGQIKIMYNWTNSKFNNNLGIDLINVTVKYIKSTFLLNITTNTDSIPVDTYYYLEINYSCDDTENYSIYAWNNTSWALKGNLTSPSGLFNTTIDSEVINNNVSVRILDQNPAGSTQGNLYIDYQRIHGITAGLPSGYHLNVTTNTTNVPHANSSELQLKYDVSGDSFTVQIKNGTSMGWDNATTLNASGMPYRNISLLSSWLLPDGTFSGNMASINKYYVNVRYLGENVSANGTLRLDYQRVYSK